MVVVCVGGVMVELLYWGVVFYDWEGYFVVLVGLIFFGFVFFRDVEN